MRTLWRTDRSLVGTAILMLPVLAFSLAGLVLDPRTITGAPAWLKPAKFAVSIALFTLTLAWIFTYLPAVARMRRIVGWTTSATLVSEMIIIALQAWRGTTSHFNVGTPFDGALWIVMGIAIATQTVASVAVAYALWRQPFTDRALGWALRLGVSVSILGASTGWLMTRPTSDSTRKGAGRRTASGRGRSYRRSGRWRSGTPGYGMESFARRPARPAFHGPSRPPGAPLSRTRALPQAHSRRETTANRVIGLLQLRGALLDPAVAGLAGRPGRSPGRIDRGRSRRVGHRDLSGHDLRGGRGEEDPCRLMICSRS